MSDKIARFGEFSGTIDVLFKDMDGESCALIQSSAINHQAIWLGPERMLMYLSPSDVAELLPLLRFFAIMGRLPQERDFDEDRKLPTDAPIAALKHVHDTFGKNVPEQSRFGVYWQKVADWLKIMGQLTLEIGDK